jgi:hypothetical protein
MFLTAALFELRQAARIVELMKRRVGCDSHIIHMTIMIIMIGERHQGIKVARRYATIDEFYRQAFIDWINYLQKTPTNDSRPGEGYYYRNEFRSSLETVAKGTILLDCKAFAALEGLAEDLPYMRIGATNQDRDIEAADCIISIAKELASHKFITKSMFEAIRVKAGMANSVEALLTRMGEEATEGRVGLDKAYELAELW